MKWIGVLLVVLASGYGADWLNNGGDPQGSNWQRHGKALTVANAGNLKLLWKRELDERPARPELLSSPVIIGPTITHRGVRELVFLADGHDNLYAFDADLGTLFWKRHFDVKPRTPCRGGMPAAPVIEPDPDEDLSGDPLTDDEDDDEAGPMRPLYAVSSDGRLHTIRVPDGTDAHAPLDFLPPDAGVSDLNFWSGTVYAGTAGCNGARGLWSIDVKKPGAKPAFYSYTEGYRVVISASGAVYGGVADGIVSLAPGGLKTKQRSQIPLLAFTVLRYRDRELLAAGTRDGRLVLLDAGDLRVVSEYAASHERFGGIATWQDSGGVRWIYANSREGVRGFKLTGPASSPKLEYAWTSARMGDAGQPAVTNGIVFLSGYNALIALEAATGKELYSSGDAIKPVAYAPALAVANGHICFADAGYSLYCFGIPMER